MRAVPLEAGSDRLRAAHPDDVHALRGEIPVESSRQRLEGMLVACPLDEDDGPASVIPEV